MEWKRLIWYRASPALIVILGISYTADGLSALPSGLVAWGTILLAFATFTLIRHSREQEKQRRGDELAKEKRDKDERLLNEIIEWATDLNKCAWELEYTISTGASLEEYQVYREANVFSRWRAADAKSEYIKSIAPTFGEDLHSAVENIKKQLDKLLALKWKSLKYEKGEEKKKLSEETRDTEEKLYEFVKTLTRVAAKYKTRDIG